MSARTAPPLALNPSTLPLILGLSKDEHPLRMYLSPATRRRSWFDQLTMSGAWVALRPMLFASCLAVPIIAHAQTPSPVLARDRIVIAGLSLEASPAHQTVPRNIATGVTVRLVASSDGATDASSAIPSDAVVYAELRGPAFGAPVALVGRVGEPLKIQPLPLEGTYLLENIRLVSGGSTFMQATPDTVTIDVIDKVLVSQVTTRPLTANEIQQKGIVVDQTNFDVVNFTAAFGIAGGQQTIDFPIVMPKRPSASLPATPVPPTLPPLTPAAVLPPPQALPQLQQVFQTNNVSVSGLVLKIDDEEIDRQFTIPPIPGVIIIPGNIAFLHQFFSVLLMVSNVAPGASLLTVRDVTATIVLPPGADTVPGSNDDPLRMARTGTPPTEQSRTQPVVRPGPDGKLGTADDIATLSPGDNGNSEFLVEGRKEGTHTVQIEIHATLDGLPVGPVTISGFATGIVEVRNPTFSLTLSHPATVMAGDPYDLLVTVTNTSDSPANFVSVNLSPNSISGAALDSDSSVTLDTIAAHDAATAAFHLISQQTGNVTATSFTSDDAPGTFVLRTSVGALGIPPSPNSLVLPPAANGLPAAVRTAAISLLGQAYALATSPVVPTGLKPVTPQIVFERATDVTEAGQRIQMGDAIARVAADLALDLLGNGLARIPERFPDDDAAAALVQRDYAGFDVLSRLSPRGAALMKALADVFRSAAETAGALTFQRLWAADAASRPPFISVMTAAGGGAAPVVLRMIGPDGQQVGTTAAGGPIARDLAFTDFFSVIDSAPAFSQLIVDAVPTSGTYRVDVNATADGTFDLGLVVPAGDRLRHLSYEGIAVTAGARATLTFSLDGSDPTLSIDDDRDGAVDRTVAPQAVDIVDAGPSVVSAVQVVTGAPDPTQFGQVVGVLFSEEVAAPSVELTDAAGAKRFAIESNEVLGASLQPGGRVLLLSLRDGVGPLVARGVTVSGITDRFGHEMSPAIATVPIAMTIDGNGASMSGQVRGADGTPIHDARLQLSQQAPTATAQGELAGIGDLATEKEVTVTIKDLDASGRYSFDYVRQFPSAGAFVRLHAVNLDTGESGEVVTRIARPGHLDVDIIFVGTGTLAGRALAPDGTPLAGAFVKVSSLTRIGQAFGAVTDNGGVFSIAGIPAGSFTIEAVHVATNARTVQAGSIPAAGATVVQNLTLIPLAEVVLTTGSVRGQVFHASDGAPASGVPVYTDRGGLATTDAAGNFRIDTLPTGPVTIRAIDQARLEQGSTTALVVSNADTIANVVLAGGTGTIHGLVVDATDHAIANAIVGGGIALVRTAADGTFVLNDVPIGPRTVSALDESTQSTASASVTLVSAGETVNVRIRLPGQGSIAGRVFEADGVTPIAGIAVFLLGPTNASTATDANGGYRFDRVPLGAYKVSAFKDGFSDGNVAETKVVFQGEVRVTNVVARGKGRVTGIVLAADGQTPLGARVGFSELTVATGTLAPAQNPACLGDVEIGDAVIEMPKCQTLAIGFSSTPLTRIVDTDVSTGTFTFDNVFVGGFTVEAANAFSPAIMRAAGAISHAGETVPVTLKLQATSVVKGVVFQPDGVTPAGKNVVVTLNSGTLSNVNVITDENGAYLYPLVNAGTFSVTASDPSTGLVGRSDGAVEGGANANVSIRLLGTGAVKVNVAGSNGAIAGAVVTVTRGTFPDDSRQGVTHADGSITFAAGDALTEGPFGVSAFDHDSGVTGFGSGTVTPANGLTVVTVRLDDEVGTVHGRFVMPDGVTPIPNAQARLTSARGQAFATTDADGRFGVDGAFGNFIVETFDPVTARRGRGTGTIAVNHQDVTVDVVAGAQGTVTGVVRFSKDSTPVAAADVTLSVDSPFAGQLATSTGVDGSFTFPGVAAGALTVSVRDPVTGLTGSVTSTLDVEGQIVDVLVVVQVPKLGRVQGTVTRADGTAAIGARVTVGGVQTTVDNGGSYSVDNVPIGRVVVRADAAAGNDGGVASGDLSFDGDVVTIGVTFIGTGSVTSVIRTAIGAPVPFAAVTLTTRNVLQRNLSLTAAADADGRIRFDDVPVGDVTVTAVDTPTSLAGSASGQLPADTSTLDLFVALQPAGSLRARVVREDGQTPAVGLAVEISGQSQRFGSTSADGTFTFVSLPVGIYQLVVTDPLGTGIVRAAAVISQAGQVVDIGTLVLDETAPHVVEIVPANATAAVPVTQPITVAFSEAVDSATVTTDTIRVATPAGPVAGTWSLGANGTTATFVASAPYRDFTPVSIRVTTSVADLVGKPLSTDATSSFTTADSTPPSVVSRTPPAGAREVAPNTVIRIAYSEAVDPSRFTGQPMALSLNDTPIGGRVDFVLGNTAIVFTPLAPLTPNGTYRVALQPASDLFGNRETAGSTFTFATVDTIGPAIDSFTAGGDHIKVGRTLTPTAVVSAQDVARVDLLVNGSVVATDSAAPFTFTVPIAASLAPSFTLTARATDLVGNTGDPKSLTMIVDADLPPTAAITSPPAGAIVDPGSRLLVTVHAEDDTGVARVGLQTVGGANTIQSRTVEPPAASVDVTFAVDVPVDAPADAPIDLKVAAIDTLDQSSTTSTVRIDVAAPDSTPPRVSAIEPPDKAVDVSIATPIQITFTEAVKATTVTADTFRVVVDGNRIAGTFSSLDDDTIVRFVPNDLLPLGTVAAVEVLPAITDRFGNALADTDGRPLSGPLTFTFATGTFAITKPAPNVAVIENSRMTLEAQGSASLGIASVTFAVNGTALPAVNGPSYVALFDVPSRASATTLTIVAIARDGGGRSIATTQVTVPVTIGLQVSPPIVGVPTGGTGTVRLSLSSALPQDLPISFEPVDPTVTSPPSAVLPAGQLSKVISVEAASAGNTTVIARSDHGDIPFVVSVSDPIAQQMLTPLAPAAGAVLRMPPIAAQLVVPSGTPTIAARVTSAPVATDTPVIVSSSDEAVARVVGTPIAQAGQRVAPLTIATGVHGTATLTIRTGSEVVRMLVVVGEETAASMPSLAAPVGVSILSVQTVGQVFTSVGGRQPIVVRLLTAPAAVETPVAVASSNTGVASVDGPAVVRAGEQAATITVVTGAAGSASLTFNAGGPVRVLDVTVGASTAAVPPIVARPIGISVTQPLQAAVVIAPTDTVSIVSVRVLAAPATADTAVTISSSNPNVATVNGPATVHAGERVAQVGVTTLTEGTAVITMTSGDQIVRFTVISGTPRPGDVPAIVAPLVGVKVRQ